jgi:hypothetical protein
MIVPIHSDSAPRHALEPLVHAAMRANPPASDTLRAAWDSVLQVMDDVPHPCLRQPDAAALLFAKAVAACNQADVARRFVAMTPCVARIADRIRVERLSLSAIRALVSGVVRPIPDSALSAGLVVVVDGTPFRNRNDFELDLLVLPLLRTVLTDALELIAMEPARGMVALRGWRVPGGGARANAMRRSSVESLFEQLPVEGRRPLLVWHD